MENLQTIHTIAAHLVVIKWCLIVLSLTMAALLAMRIWYVVSEASKVNTANSFGNVIHEYIEKGMSDDLIAVAERELAEHPNYSRALYALGIGHFQKHNDRDALASFEKLLLINPAYEDYVKEYIAAIKARDNSAPNQGVQGTPAGAGAPDA